MGRNRRDESGPVLRFTPYAWAKLLYLRDVTGDEVGGFGLSAAEDLLLVQDVALIQQEVSPVSVRFDDEAVADHFERQAEAGRPPERAGRIWVHTHPGDCPYPSCVDEETFQRVFGRCHWAVMFILARGGRSYARLRFGVGPAAEIEIPVEVDYHQPFQGSEPGAWELEHQANVRSRDLAMGVVTSDLDMLDELAWLETAALAAEPIDHGSGHPGVEREGGGL